MELSTGQPPTLIQHRQQQQEPDDKFPSCFSRTLAKIIMCANKGGRVTRQPQMHEDQERGKRYYMILLGINYMCLFVGSVSSSLLSKFYFNHKGGSRWVSTWVQCAGFPLLLFPIYLFKICTHRKPFTGFTPKLLCLSILIGFLLGFNNLLYSWGNSYLPVSTNSLVLSTQLVFTLITSVIIVKQKVTFANLNCVILLTLSSVLLALGSSHDKPIGLTKAKYFIGFFSTVGAGLLFAFYLPIMEKIYRKVYCYAMVVEMQLVMEMAATTLATVGMAIDGGFTEMKTESIKVFDLGPKAYWLTVGFNVVTWQLCFMGTAGMVFLTTSLTGGVCMTAIMGINVLGGVLVYRDHFGGLKAVSTLLCLWGFCSYVYGIYIKMKNEEEENHSKELENSLQKSDHQPNQFMELAEIVTYNA
ncbi:probable purine permease 4 [Lycium ferocissimum]|uniref:probable purine permease 4 n=1 Tax=Lycium ferocissimum TaxID=112874 RepID=UPI002816395A|nr:probable purine permease 4 [Lycium ferocissimum]